MDLLLWVYVYADASDARLMRELICPSIPEVHSPLHAAREPQVANRPAVPAHLVEAASRSIEKSTKQCRMLPASASYVLAERYVATVPRTRSCRSGHVSSYRSIGPSCFSKTLCICFGATPMSVYLIELRPVSFLRINFNALSHVKQGAHNVFLTGIRIDRSQPPPCDKTNEWRFGRLARICCVLIKGPSQRIAAIVVGADRKRGKCFASERSRCAGGVPVLLDSCHPGLHLAGLFCRGRWLSVLSRMWRYWSI